MAPNQSASIQSFFKSSKPGTSHAHAQPVASSETQSKEPGDGFTVADVEAVLHPVINDSWVPTQDYDEFEIANLVPGPKCVTIQGRVANFYDQNTPSKKPRAAKGCVKIIVKDDSGALTVRLWYANCTYNLRLGQLVSIWTPHVSNGEHGSLASSQAPLFTSIFPERDRSCHFMIHENSDEGVLCKTPLGYREGQPLAGLMTLKNFVDGGYDVIDGRMLVCVKSVGARKKITNKKGVANELVNINIFDDTAEATLTLWGPSALSASTWEPSKTILFISSPGWRIDRRTYISLTSSTLIDIDPNIPDAEWLRTYAERLTRHTHINPSFPYKSFDLQAARESENQILFTFSELDQFIRSSPESTFTGYLNVMITEINITPLHRRHQLLCNEHCGHPLFSNQLTAKCKNCEKDITLEINPKVLGTVCDETGASAGGKRIMSSEAWEGLLGRTKEELVVAGMEVLEYLEMRLLFLRVTLRFAWAAEEGEGGMGRLCIWDVCM
ncbi:hypothetical protein E6O75_ATG06156 [Venturia nashicola]|uniref:Nucleic acid-binding protein n=1 Tax=Venturia nashicola TaxID=86259 RepID=A0A4Z1P4B8_9PEZI|nr:hypothetical protein E6O75_ATG06156 [Venturia nashicola]